MSKTVNGAKTTHLWDGSNIVIDLDGNGSIKDIYTRGINLISNNKNQYFVFNAHGDVVQLANFVGAIIKNYEYDAFGVEENEEKAEKADLNLSRYAGEYFDLTSGIDDSYFTGFENAIKTIKSRPDNGKQEEVFMLVNADPFAWVMTSELNLTRNETYVLEFDYWADTDGVMLYTDFITTPTSWKGVVAKQTVQRAKMEVCYDSPNMLNSYLRFISVHENNIYVSNIRLYHKETAATGAYLSANNVQVKTKDLFWLMEASLGPVLRPGTWLPVEGLTLKKTDICALANTPEVRLKPNTDYVLEFEYWADADGLTLGTDVYPVSPSYQFVTANKAVQKARIVFNYSDPKMANTHVRLYNYAESNIYVANLVLYEKQRLGEPASDSNPWRYCGEYFDEETGNIYLRARYYVPKLGRFMSEDPIKSGVNWYTYCINNPLRFTDSTGLDPALDKYISENYPGQITITIVVRQAVPGTTLAIDSSVSDPGHTFIRLDYGDGRVYYYGLYMDYEVQSGLLEMVEWQNSEVRADDAQGWNIAKPYTITTEQADAVTNFVGNYDKKFHLAQNNCTTFAVDALRAGGVWSPTQAAIWNVPHEAQTAIAIETGGGFSQFFALLGAYGYNPGRAGEDIRRGGDYITKDASEMIYSHSKNHESIRPRS